VLQSLVAPALLTKDPVSTSITVTSGISYDEHPESCRCGCNSHSRLTLQQSDPVSQAPIAAVIGVSSQSSQRLQQHGNHRANASNLASTTNQTRCSRSPHAKNILKYMKLRPAAIRLTSKHHRVPQSRLGQYLRSRRAPCPDAHPEARDLRGKFGSASAGWQSLTRPCSQHGLRLQRVSVVDALGQSVVLTGQQYFIGLQPSLMNAGQHGYNRSDQHQHTCNRHSHDYADANGTLIVSCFDCRW